MELAIITPSYIHSRTRYLFAKKSFESLERTFGDHHRHIVVNDELSGTGVIPEGVRGWLPVIKWNEKAKEIYHKGNVTLIGRCGSGSSSASLDAVLKAREEKVELIFIHLDDHIYIPAMRDLVEYACDAFRRDNELLMVRFSGYPQIYNGRIPLERVNDRISFDKVVLKPERRDEYTLWWSYFNEDTVEEKYYSIALWFCIYRLEFLKKVLSYPPVQGMKHLCHVEAYYKNKENWKRFLKEVRGKFGYINMQFGGFEMHRNKNWRELIEMPNNAIR